MCDDGYPDLLGIGAQQHPNCCYSHDFSSKLMRENDSDDSLSEMKSLSSIRDALHILEELLELLQRLLSQHQSQRHTAILRLEESRLSLLKRQQATDVLKFHNPKSKDSFSECAYCPLPKNALPENPENTPEQNTLKSINMRMHGKRRWLFSLSFRFLWNRTMFQRLIVVAGSMLALLQLQRAAVSEHVARIGDGKCRRNDCFSMNYEGVAEIGIPSRSCRSSLDVFHRRG